MKDVSLISDNYLYIKALTLSDKPYYRGRYDVVRPNGGFAGNCYMYTLIHFFVDARALNWRAPEEYPAPYETNRKNNDYDTIARDYGYTAKL